MIPNLRSKVTFVTKKSLSPSTGSLIERPTGGQSMRTNDISRIIAKFESNLQCDRVGHDDSIVPFLMRSRNVEDGVRSKSERDVSVTIAAIDQIHSLRPVGSEKT